MPLRATVVTARPSFSAEPSESAPPASSPTTLRETKLLPDKAGALLPRLHHQLHWVQTLLRGAGRGGSDLYMCFEGKALFAH
jgi:hypothetical protein